MLSLSAVKKNRALTNQIIISKMINPPINKKISGQRMSCLCNEKKAGLNVRTSVLEIRVVTETLT